MHNYIWVTLYPGRVCNLCAETRISTIAGLHRNQGFLTEKSKIEMSHQDYFISKSEMCQNYNFMHTQIRLFSEIIYQDF